MTWPNWKISMHSQTLEWKKKDWVFLSSQHFVKPSHYCCQLNSCMILLFLYNAHFEVILLQVCCTFCGLAQWEDVILVVEGDILQVSYYLACRIQFLEGGGGNYIPKTFASFFSLSLSFSLWDLNKVPE